MKTKIKTETIETPLVWRHGQFEITDADRADGEEHDRRIGLSFSSEDPARQWFGTEILDHGEDAVRMDFISSGRAPLLLGHDRRTQIGVVESASIGSDRKARAVVRFGKNARADEVFRDVLDGIRNNVSVGYRIHKMVLEKVDKDSGEETYRVTDWAPLEISIVSIPADTTVGVGRSDTEKFETIVERTIPMADKIEDKKKEDEKIAARAASDAPGITEAERAKAIKEIGDQESSRIRQIIALGARHNKKDKADTAIEKGVSVELFKGMLLDGIGDDNPLDSVPADLGMSKKEARDFSFVRLLHAKANPDNKAAYEAAAFEIECSNEIAKRMGRDPQGNFVPLDAQVAMPDGIGEGRHAIDVMRGLAERGHLPAQMVRELSVGTDTAGGFLVGTDHMAGSFIGLLRNAMMVRRLGARILSGLVGNIEIPKHTGGATAGWVGEAATLPESDLALGQLAMSPNSIGAFTELSKKLLRQSSPDIELLVRADLAISVALKLDATVINGSGTGAEPQGILGSSGIGDVFHGTDGGAPTWPLIVDIWKEVAIDNADFGATGWLTNTNVIAKLAATEKAANTAQFIANLPDGQGFSNIAGQRAAISNQVPSNLTKGSGANLSALIYGNWADVLIGEWGVLDLLVNPYSKDTSAQIRVTVYDEMDVAFRRVESFSAAQDIDTT